MADFKSLQFEQALQSGRDKHNWYDSRVANQVIEEVEQLLETKNLKVEVSFWKDCWLLEKHAPAGGSANFNDLLRIALMFLYFYSAAYKWLSEMRFDSSDLTSFVKSDEEVNGYYKIYKGFKRKGEQDRFKLFYKATKWEEKDKINNLLSTFSYSISQSEKIINKIESDLTEKTSTYSARYNTVILLYIKAPDYKDVEKIIQKTYNEEPESYKKAKLNFALLDSSQNNTLKYGLFIQDNDKDSCMYLLRFYLKIEKKAVAYMYPTNAIFMPYSPSEFNHNLRKHIQKNIQEYNKDLENDFKEIDSQLNNLLMPKHVHQLSFLYFMSLGSDYKESFEAEVKKYGYNYPPRKKQVLSTLFVHSRVLKRARYRKIRSTLNLPFW